jgi:hypothetical protein
MYALKTWLDILKALITIIAALLGGVWVWCKFVVERGLLPPSEMDGDLRTAGSSALARVIEVAVRIKNKGGAALVVTDLRIRLRFLNKDEIISVFDDPKQPTTFGRVKFLHAHVLNGVGDEPRIFLLPDGGKHGDGTVSLGRGEFLLIPYDTFVQPGVCQTYTFVTALPLTAAYVLTHASFRYEARPSRTQLMVLRISRKLGILQYSLDHIRKPHTFERVFCLDQP